VIAGLVWVVSELPILRQIHDRGWLVLGAVTALVVVISLLLYRLLSRISWLFVSPFRQRPPGQRRPRRGSGTATGTPPAEPDRPAPTTKAGIDSA
jgi:hypothetical protein